MSQSTAPLREMVPGRVGLIAEAFGPCDVRSRLNASAKSYFGRLVLRDSGSGEDHVAHPAGALAAVNGTVIDGIISSTHTLESQKDGDEPNYPAKETLNVVRKGYIWVAIDQDVAVGDPVFVRHTGGGEGKFRMDADTANAQDISAVAKWEKGGTAAEGIALLEINLI